MNHMHLSTTAQSRSNHFNSNSLLIHQHMRMFTQKDEKAQEEAKAHKAEQAKLKEEVKEKPSEPEKQTKTASKKQEDTSSSSDEDTAGNLSPEDVKKIKALIADQDKEIETLKEQNKQYKEKLIYQLAENDNTIKRYKKEIDSTKDFAISKFAKDLLEVRDNLQLANDHIKKLKIAPEVDLNELNNQFKQVVIGMEMTSTVMDSCLKRFNVVQFSPKGEKFNPNLHEAIFTIPTTDASQNNQVGEVMQSGWMIGERILRAAKVGILKK